MNYEIVYSVKAVDSNQEGTVRFDIYEGFDD